MISSLSSLSNMGNWIKTLKKVLHIQLARLQISYNQKSRLAKENIPIEKDVAKWERWVTNIATSEFNRLHDCSGTKL